MKNKKILSLILAVLMLALVSPAFAAEENPEDSVPTLEANTTVGSVFATRTVAIDVTVPTEKKLFINPLGFPIEVNGKEETSQIIFEPSYIENKSIVPVSVTLTTECTLNENSDMRLTSGSLKDAETTRKCAFIYLEMEAVSDPDQVTWAEEYDSDKHACISTSTRSKRNIVTLSQAGGETPYGAFRLTGDCVRMPRSPWTEADGMTIILTFSFRALPLTEAASD